MVYWSIADRVSIIYKGKIRGGSLWFDFVNQRYKVQEKESREYLYKYTGNPFKEFNKEEILKEFKRRQQIDFTGIKKEVSIKK